MELHIDYKATIWSKRTIELTDDEYEKLKPKILACQSKTELNQLLSKYCDSDEWETLYDTEEEIEPNFNQGGKATVEVFEDGTKEEDKIWVNTQATSTPNHPDFPNHRLLT